MREGFHAQLDQYENSTKFAHEALSWREHDIKKILNSWQSRL